MAGTQSISGLVSGLVACLMGLLLIVVWMRFLVRDPLMISEFAERGPADGAHGHCHPAPEQHPPGRDQLRAAYGLTLGERAAGPGARRIGSGHDPSS